MKTTFISTQTLWNSPRSNLAKMQSDLAKANKEMVTGRDVDVGLRLGFRAGETLSLRQERAHLDAIIDGNAPVKVRLEASSAALARARTAAEEFMGVLIGAPLSERNLAVVAMQAESSLGGLLSDLNKEVSGQYLFGGINTGKAPVTAYSGTPPSAAKTALDTAFLAHFGFTQNDPAVAALEPSDIEAFIDGPLQALYDAASWNTNWSSASDKTITSMISASEKIETSVNANEAAFREMAKGYTMIFDLGVSGMKDTTREALLSRAITAMSSGATAASDIEARLGVAKQKLESANERMGIQKTIFDEKLFQLEGVDPLEAKIRVDNLTTQIQTSFSLTAQLRSLSLINFI